MMNKEMNRIEQKKLLAKVITNDPKTESKIDRRSSKFHRERGLKMAVVDEN